MKLLLLANQTHYRLLKLMGSHAHARLERCDIHSTGTFRTTDTPEGKRLPKPDLRSAGQTGRIKQSRFIIVACLLVTLYMYPMIFRPMFAIGMSAEEETLRRKESGVDPSKTRPSFMPEWSSPFGSKDEDDDE